MNFISNWHDWLYQVSITCTSLKQWITNTFCIPLFYSFCNYYKKKHFVTDSVMYRDALFIKYGIRDFSVRLDRLNERDIPEAIPKLHLKSSGNVRGNSKMSWFPATSSMQQKSGDALSPLIAYHNRNGIASRLVGRCGFHYFSFYVDMKFNILKCFLVFSYSKIQ